MLAVTRRLLCPPLARYASTSAPVNLASLPEGSSTQEAADSAPAPSVARRRRREQVDTGNVDLVAPTDPNSNMRPIMYAASRRRRPSNSPYSSAEFPPEAAGSGAAARAHELELAFTLHRERVDMVNHRFWATTNADFEAQKERRLAALSPSDPPTAEDEAAREAVLTQFYRDWQIGTRARQQAWVKNWWSDVWDGIKLQGKVYIARWRAGLW